MKRVLFAAVILIAAIVVGGVALLWTPDTDPDAMKAKYGGPEARFAEAVGGMRVHYRVSGPEGAPVLVMIHGTGASLHTWEPLRERLDNRFRVVAYDQPGHGLTGPHPERDYEYSGMVDALDAVFAAEGIEEAVLIGNSMGGWVAWRDAIENPARVRALVLVDASGLPYDAASDPIGFRIMTSPIGRTLASKLTPRSLIEQSVYDAIEKDEVIDEAMVDRYWELLRYPGNRSAMVDQFAGQREDASERLSEITQPTLIVWGSEDLLIPVESAVVFERRIPDAYSVVYDGVGHIPQEEVPDIMARDLRAFLRRIDSANPLAKPPPLRDMSN